MSSRANLKQEVIKRIFGEDSPFNFKTSNGKISFGYNRDKDPNGKKGHKLILKYKMKI